MDRGGQSIVESSAGGRLQVLLESYHRLTGNRLTETVDTLWRAPFAVLSHDTSDPPRFIYANARTLALFGYPAAELIGMPSYKSAEADQRAQRAAMFERLEAEDIVTGYTGIRVAADGTRFRIVDAVIWNLRDAGGVLHGQAARIDRVEPLEDAVS